MIDAGALSILQLEQAFLSSWPAIKSETNGAFIWHYAYGFTKRANSAQVNGFYPMDIDDKQEVFASLMRYIDWAKALAHAPIFRVTPFASDIVKSTLSDLGWSEFAHSLVMLKALKKEKLPIGNYKIFDAREADFYLSLARLNKYEAKDIKALKEILSLIKNPAAGILLYDDRGKIIGAVLLSIKDRIVLISNLIIDKNFQGKGYAKLLMQVANEWAISKGAKWGALQVVVNNMAAKNLYHSLGYKDKYSYHYCLAKKYENT
jgi:ribosomal protein S18 acetylase RimI-like enzyme